MGDTLLEPLLTPTHSDNLIPTKTATKTSEPTTQTTIKTVTDAVDSREESSSQSIPTTTNQEPSMNKETDGNQL